MLKDLQEKLQKEKEQQVVTSENKEDDAKPTTDSDSQTNKKRHYDTAFQGKHLVKLKEIL